MANLGEKRSIEIMDNEAWNGLVVDPVMQVIKNKFKKEDLADVSHVTLFVLTYLSEEMEQMIKHVAYTENPADFACMSIIASAAPKTVYKTLFQTIPAFVEQFAKENGLPAHTTTRMQKYFTSLREHSGTRLSLMFIRDAVYISSPSNRVQLAKLDTCLSRADINSLTKLLTLAMCSAALGTSLMGCPSDLKLILPTLILSLESSAGCAFISRGDSMSKTPATEHSLNRRKAQIVKFLFGMV
jgi:hypothetical protein